MVTPAGEPEWVLIVDPIDGTRPAMAGFEAACVSVAAARLDGEPTMGDVEVGCVVEIKSGAAFVAERGGGLEPAPRLSANTDLGADVLGLRAARAAGAGDRRGARRADRRAPRSAAAPSTSARRPYDMTRVVDRPARRLHRAGAADGRRRARDARGVRGASAAARCSTTRPTTSPPRSLCLRGGGRGGHRRLRRAARRPAAARLGRRVPDLLRRGGQRASSTRGSAQRIDAAAVERLALRSTRSAVACPRASGSRPRPQAPSPTTPTSPAAS